MKDILYGQEIREKMLSGICAAADAVKATLGPRGRNVMIMEDSGRPQAVKNGAVALRFVELEDPYENMGVQMIKEAALKMEELAGDGTASSVVLADSILRECIKNITAGANSMELRKGIQGAVQLSCAAIRKLSLPVKSAQDICSVAAVSSESLAAGKMIAEAMEKIGPEGNISVEETTDMETTLEVAEGMQYEKGYLNVEMLKDPGSGKEELDYPFILVTDSVISNTEDILPVLEQIRSAGYPLLIISENVAAGALSLLVMNKRRGIIDAVAVHPPAYGDGRLQRMEDICIFTGGVFISERLGHSLKNVSLEMLGRAEKVLISKNNTQIINGQGNPAQIRKHLAGLRHSIETEDYDFKKKRMEERLAKFTGGTARIRVGAPTETEMKERKYRLEGAVKSAKAALEGGVVPGGGSIYLEILPAVRSYVSKLEGDRKTGASIILHALETPIRQIVWNGGQDPAVTIDKVKRLPRGFGYDIINNEYVDMRKAGILDSARAAELSLKCAASAAAILITVESGVLKGKKEGNRAE